MSPEFMSPEFTGPVPTSGRPRPTEVDLEFLARQFERVISDLATLKDDAMVVTARLDRIDATVQSLVVEVRAMHSRHGRLARRVDRLEERMPSDG